MDKQEACSQFKTHPVRKICKTCRRSREDHLLSEDDAEIVKQNLKVLTKLPQTERHVKYAWTPPNCPTKRMDEYFQKFPHDQVPSHKSEGQENRLKRLIYQIPLPDLSLENCRFVEDNFKSDMKSYAENLQTTTLRVGEVKEWSQGMAVQCPKCLLILEPDELVVTTDENGGQVFHPTCFVCFQCHDYLADLIYCSDVDGTVFCLRHYSDNVRKRCHACDELIFATKYALAGEKFYHKNHLLCFACDKPPEDSKALEKEREMYCRTCYEERFCSNCIKCLKRIKVENRHIAYKDKNFHYDCFTCCKCDAPIADSQFEIVDEEFLCMECYNKEHAPRCGGCDEIFDRATQVVNYEGKTFHVPCFKCVDCREVIGSGSFVPHKGRVYCKACHLRNFGVKCFRCGYSITDEEGILYDQKPYHKDCFTCSKCSTKIANRPFKNVNDDWYCIDCYTATFCKTCHSCKAPIRLGVDEDILFSYQEYRWHANCFICSVCENNLAGNSFTIRNEKTLVCKECLTEKTDDEDQVAEHQDETTREQEESGTAAT